MASQIHTKFTTEQVKELLQKYINGEVERKHLQEILGVKKAMFFRTLQAYRKDQDAFSVDYKRSSPTRSIDSTVKDNIIKELSIDKKGHPKQRNPAL